MWGLASASFVGSSGMEGLQHRPGGLKCGGRVGLCTNVLTFVVDGVRLSATTDHDYWFKESSRMGINAIATRGGKGGMQGKEHAIHCGKLFEETATPDA